MACVDIGSWTACRRDPAVSLSVHVVYLLFLDDAQYDFVPFVRLFVIRP